MEAALEHWIQGLSGPVVGILIIASLLVLGKGADWLVDQAVTLSLRWHIPQAVVGATVVSLGTTMPEAAVSVFAALRGSPELALGNAVGSIICDTGLILGVAILIQPIRLDPKIVNRQGWLQLGAGLLLVLASLPFGNLSQTFISGGRLPQFMGYVFLVLLIAYIFLSIHWARGEKPSELGEAPSENTLLVFVKLVGSIALVIGASWVLIPSVREAATRLSVPEGIIAATLVAFGTSLPELVTAVTAARRGHGELALGNVIGADILNALFVAGAAAAVTPGGLEAPAHFFKLLFPAMLLVLVVFRFGIFISKKQITRPFGLVLLLVYAIATFMSYAIK